MATDTSIQEGQIIIGPLFNEPMRVIIVRSNGKASIEVGLEGMETSSFRSVSLTSYDIANLKITDPHPTCDGDGNLLRPGLQAYSMGIAHEFDPYFGLSISRVDPLPHQMKLPQRPVPASRRRRCGQDHHGRPAGPGTEAPRTRREYWWYAQPASPSSGNGRCSRSSTSSSMCSEAATSGTSSE